MNVSNIDPIFPRPPVINPPLYKYKPGVSKTSNKDPDEPFKLTEDNPTCPLVSSEIKAFFFVVAILSYLFLSNSN